jgi:hypothetical protein
MMIGFGLIPIGPGPRMSRTWFWIAVIALTSLCGVLLVGSFLWPGQPIFPQ